MNAKLIEDWISRVLLERGFEKQKRNWYRNTQATIVMVNLDKSPDGGQFYINLAASPRELCSVERPPEHHCHIRIRLESLVPDRELLRRGLDLENPGLSTKDRERIVVDSLRDFGLPVLAAFGTLEQIRELITLHPRAARFAVRVQLQEFLKRH